MGWTGGYVLLALLLAPYLRKFGKFTVPEFIGDACQPGPIADAVLAVLADPQAQRAAMALTMERLGQGGEAPGLRAAKAVLERLDQAAIKDQ